MTHRSDFYVSGILIHEKYLAIDFARKEMVGTEYVEVVRDGLLQGFAAGDSRHHAAIARAAGSGTGRARCGAPQRTDERPFRGHAGGAG